VHVVRCLTVLSSFLENFVLGVAACFEITSGIQVTAFQDFCHVGNLLNLVYIQAETPSRCGRSAAMFILPFNPSVWTRSSKPVSWIQSARKDLLLVYEALDEPEKAKAVRAELAAPAK